MRRDYTQFDVDKLCEYERQCVVEKHYIYVLYTLYAECCRTVYSTTERCMTLLCVENTYFCLHYILCGEWVFVSLLCDVWCMRCPYIYDLIFINAMACESFLFFHSLSHAYFVFVTWILLHQHIFSAEPHTHTEHTQLFHLDWRRSFIHQFENSYTHGLLRQRHCYICFRELNELSSVVCLMMRMPRNNFKILSAATTAAAAAVAANEWRNAIYARFFPAKCRCSSR